MGIPLKWLLVLVLLENSGIFYIELQVTSKYFGSALSKQEVLSNYVSFTNFNVTKLLKLIEKY